MEQKKIDRINELAQKPKTTGLTEEELSERAALRREYIEGYRRSLVAQLDNTYLVDENGNKSKLRKRD